MIPAHLLGATRLVGNDKVPPEERLSLRYVKAVRQGLTCGHTRLLPAFDALPPWAAEAARAEVRDRITWAAALPRSTVDGRRIK